MNTLAQGFTLDALRVEPRTGIVTGPGGRERLDPKVMDVLVLMAGRPGEVVLREDLLAALWPNVVVTEDALTRCFYELRRHLGRATGDDRFRTLIETVPKRGYRLHATVGPLTVQAEPAAPAPSLASASRLSGRSRGGWAALGAAAALLAVGAALFTWRGLSEKPAVAEGPHAIAVLPFLDMSAQKDQGYFSDGVTEEILNALSQAENLRVISRTSSFALRNETLDVPGIAKRLGVDYVLEGSVRKSGGRVRITAQLIDVTTNSHVWSQTYDRALDDLFAVQDEIAASVASALQVTLAGITPGGRMSPHLDAYERYLQGQFFYNRRSPGDVQRSLTAFRQAVDIDPSFARAWAALAGAYSLEIGSRDVLAAAPLRELQGAAARKAVELDPKLAVAHARLAQFLFQSQQYPEGHEHLGIATALDPNDGLVLGFNASEAAWVGDYAEALRIWRKIVAQDPLSAAGRANLGHMLQIEGDLEGALAEKRRALELSPDMGPALHAEIARLLIALGRRDEAAAAIARMPAGLERDYVIALSHREPGMEREADAALARLVEAPRDVPTAIRLAEIYADRGQSDDAFRLLADYERQLESQRELRPRELWYFQDEMRLSPYLRPLQSDPRWAEVAREPA